MPKSHIEPVAMDRDGEKVSGRRVTIASVFDRDDATIFDAVRQPETLYRICSPLAKFDLQSGPTERDWQEGARYMYAMGGLAAKGTQEVLVTSLDAENMRITTAETGDTAEIWNHEMLVTPLSDGTCEYRDTIDLYAGKKTQQVATMCRAYYTFRQSVGWRRILKEM